MRRARPPRKGQEWSMRADPVSLGANRFHWIARDRAWRPRATGRL